MRLLRHVLPALALVVAGTGTTQALACDKHKAAKTGATAAISAAHQAELAAAEKAPAGAGAKASAVAASQADRCAAKGTKAAAVTADADHCGSKSVKAAFVLAGAGAACGVKGGKTTAAAAGAACRGHGMTTMAGKTGHPDCDACADMAICHEEIEAAGVRTQVVPLKNGVMFVYTAESSGKANVVQSAMARRHERLAQIVKAGDKAQLCGECKSLRGAMASGKLHREVVNIEGGALTLMTSSDPSLVAKIHTMVEHHHKGARIKS
jgi:hypothetical protein